MTHNIFLEGTPCLPARQQSPPEAPFPIALSIPPSLGRNHSCLASLPLIPGCRFHYPSTGAARTTAEIADLKCSCIPHLFQTANSFIFGQTQNSVLGFEHGYPGLIASNITSGSTHLSNKSLDLSYPATFCQQQFLSRPLI